MAGNRVHFPSFTEFRTGTVSMAETQEDEGSMDEVLL